MDVLNNEANLIIDEWRFLFSGWPEASAPLVEATEEISKKVEEARAVTTSAIVDPTQKNKGGRAFTNNAFWIEIVRIALVDGELPDRDALRKMMDEWISQNFSGGGPAESTKRQMLKELYETPGIRP